MKKLLAVTLLGLSVAAPAYAENPYYGGVSFGSTTLPFQSGTQLGFFGGYKLNRSQTPAFMSNLGGTLAIEGHYTMLGEDSWSYTTINPLNPFGPLVTATQKIKYHSFGADVVGLFPIKSVKNVSGFVKLGFANTSANMDCTVGGVSCGSGTASTSGLVWGVGAQYDVDSKISVRAGYQTYATDVTSLYAAALYNF